MEPLLLSVIVPAYQGEQVLPTVLDALRASDLPRERWELIVVDDASTDATARVAATRADAVISLPGTPHGPAYARTRGVDAARGEWVVFVDADVRVHQDTLSRFADVIKREPTVDAIFGAYDDAPPAPGVLSQYRNLLHRYVHLSSAGEADSFWAGCGAVRRAMFLAVGGFDADRFPRPQIEDIDLGYRIRDAGGRILLCPEIEGAHLKRWTFWRSMKVDLVDRGIPWVRLLLERDRLTAGAQLNLKRGERVKAAAVVAALGLLFLSIVRAAGSPVVLAIVVLAIVLLAGVAYSNRAQFRWFSARRGLWFAIVTMPLQFIYYALSATSVAIGLGERFVRRARRAVYGGRRRV